MAACPATSSADIGYAVGQTPGAASSLSTVDAQAVRWVMSRFVVTYASRRADERRRFFATGTGRVARARPWSRGSGPSNVDTRTCRRVGSRVVAGRRTGYRRQPHHRHPICPARTTQAIRGRWMSPGVICGLPQECGKPGVAVMVGWFRPAALLLEWLGYAQNARPCRHPSFPHLPRSGVQVESLRRATSPPSESVHPGWARCSSTSCRVTAGGTIRPPSAGWTSRRKDGSTSDRCGTRTRPTRLSVARRHRLRSDGGLRAYCRFGRFMSP